MILTDLDQACESLETLEKISSADKATASQTAYTAVFEGCLVYYLLAFAMKKTRFKYGKMSYHSGQLMTIMPAWGRRQRWEFGSVGEKLDHLFCQCIQHRVTAWHNFRFLQEMYSWVAFLLSHVAEGEAPTLTLGNLHPNSVPSVEYTLGHRTYYMAGTVDTTLVS